MCARFVGAERSVILRGLRRLVLARLLPGTTARPCPCPRVCAARRTRRGRTGTARAERRAALTGSHHPVALG